MKFVQLILRKIIKITTICQILRLKCTKFDFGWVRLGLCPRPRWRSLQRSPRPPSRIKGSLLLSERGMGNGGEGRGGVRERGRGGEAFIPQRSLAVDVTGCR